MIDTTIKKVLTGMLNPNPEKRLHPKQIIEMLQSDWFYNF